MSFLKDLRRFTVGKKKRNKDKKGEPEDIVADLESYKPVIKPVKKGLFKRIFVVS